MEPHTFVKRCSADRPRCAPRTEGSALVLVLWAIGLLSVLVVSMTFDAHVESRITLWLRNRTKAQALTRSGMEIAELLLIKSDAMRQNRDMEEDRWYEPAKSLSEGLAVRNFKDALGDGTITVDIVPEPARRNVNRLQTDEDWERILDVGGITEDLGLWPVLIDSFMDWLDRDDIPRMHGAETEDYYALLDPPYRAKNGPLDTVEELLLIRGFNRAILFGGVLNPDDSEEDRIVVSGIHDLLTVYGDGKVNVNAASRRVLMTLPGVDEFVAEAVLAERQGWTDEKGEQIDTSFESLADFFDRVPEADRATLQKHVTTHSQIFRITATGDVHGTVSRVWCIAQYVNRELTFLRWREDN